MSVLGFDSRRALNALRQTFAEAPVHVAERFASVVRDAPSRRLEQLMQTPARRVILEAIFRQMPQHLDRQRAAGFNGSVRWELTREGGMPDTYRLEFSDGTCTVRRAARGGESRLTITLDGADFLRLATGNLDPMQAYFSGRIKLGGDIMLAAKLASLFRIPGRAGSPPRPG